MIRVLFLLAILFFFTTGLKAQSAVNSAVNSTESAEAVQSRIERARALIAAHRLETAGSELESVRATTADCAVRNITSVMLMSVYLEEGNYARAEALLEETFQSRSPKNDDSIRSYFALAGQAVNGARTHLARYRSFAINTTDSNLPAEALKDLDRLRSLLERMIAQAKEVSNDRKAYDSLSLLEDVLGIRLSLAKDTEDQTKWASEYASVREVLASSQTEVASLGGLPMLPPSKSAAVTAKTTKSAPEGNALEKTTSSAEKQSLSNQPASDSVSSTPTKAEPDRSTEDLSKAPTANDPKVVNTGSLNAKATKRVFPLYPAIAKQSGAAGVVRVYVVVDEKGKVVKVSHTEGPILLRQAAEEAARQWSFEAISDAQGPVRLCGYIDFNFTL